MNSRWCCGLLLSLGLVAPVRAQFTLTAVAGSVEQPVTGRYDLGAVAGGDLATSRFRLRNGRNDSATLTLLTVSGSGFSLASAPSLPLTLNAQGTVDFSINFRASDPGSYSAVLQADGVSALLTIAVAPSLTCTVETAAGKLVLGSALVEFGNVELGQSSLLHFALENRTSQPLAIPSVGVGGGDFSLSGSLPAGQLLRAGEASGFDVRFTPSAAGGRSGSLNVSTRNYALTGSGILPSLPKPQVRIDLPQTSSAQQGSITVALDAPARSRATGSLTLDFRPAAGAADPTIALASGGRTATFTVEPGDLLGRFGGQSASLFQTGTTAGTLIVTARLAEASDQQSIIIAPSIAGLSAATAARNAAGIEIRITGYDNTRTAGGLSFTFFDVGGNPVTPGTLRTDATEAFARFFRESDVGGSFVLRAQFPVSGDASAVASFTAEITNSAGTATTAQTRF
ncbi:MAG: hypothetical protein C5B51_14295 [Terriglobia bacterium]|nr:MAG: hypothetical protein C5B51_14295 [Terriglobia bacterium]